MVTAEKTKKHRDILSLYILRYHPTNRVIQDSTMEISFNISSYILFITSIYCVWYDGCEVSYDNNALGPVAFVALRKNISNYSCIPCSVLYKIQLWKYWLILVHVNCFTHQFIVYGMTVVKFAYDNNAFDPATFVALRKIY